MTTRGKLTAQERRVIDMLRAIVNVVKDTIPFEQVHRALPFAVRIAAGANFNHIVIDSILPIEIDRADGDTLCGRRGGQLQNFIYAGDEQNCPGCLAIAQGLVAKEANKEADLLMEFFS